MSYYLSVIIFFLLSLFVHRTLKNKLRNGSKIISSSHMSGEEIAKKMLNDYSIDDVNVLCTEEEFSDHYNPLDKTINLSQKVFYSKDLTSLAIASHESAHAIQHKNGYELLKMRNHLVPILNFSSRFVNLAILSGLSIFYHSSGRESMILKLGIGLFFLVILFSLITLPIEFNASKRALFWIRNKKIANSKEDMKIKEYLTWAAMTYVISTLGSIIEFTYFISFFHNRHSDKE
ncbi:zinc metallopeptidase [Blattabacterium cuenoti]|uniref:zinc metallopeptidase n=1 Tax=Blattabacterium cuenoti TaxID=1653831 RepID=UPI00163C9677|nr:zinc metallopeptidase [Blattabacterium cuenoti]